MATKNFVKEVRLKFEFWGVISKGLYENETFLKSSVNGEFDFIKRPNTKSSKIACLSKTSFCKFTQVTTGA